MALTRARILTGSPALAARIEKTINEVLTAPRNKQDILKDVREMRARIFKEVGSEDPWNVKHVRGGLVDVEFITQTLQLVYAPQHPAVLTQNTIEALNNLEREKCLDPQVASDLVAAAQLLHNLTQITRVCVEGTLDPQTASQNLRTLVARAGGEETLEAVEEKLIAAEKAVHAHFKVLMEDR
jgi:glutamate-ammonia-ligase adenylyltransferase